MRGLLFYIFGVFLCLSSNHVWAGVYPWVWVGKEDIQVTDHARVEVEFRLALVRNAKKSLDIITFDQRLDAAVGLPLLQAIEGAAKRGVQIRFASSWVAPVMNDPCRKAEQYMRGIASKYPNFHFISVGGPAMWGRGWGVLDGIHEKIFVADKQLALVTGRGHADQYLGWLDTAFFYKGELVQQSLDTFEKVWSLIEVENGVDFQGEDLSQTPCTALLRSLPREAGTDPSPLSLNLSLEEQQELADFNQWASVPPSSNQDYKARSIHYNFMEQMRIKADQDGRSPRSYSYDERNKFLWDDYVDEVLFLLPGTKYFQMNILAVILDEKLNEAILGELAHGMEMELITNGRQAHSIFPTAPGWYAGIHSLDDFLQGGVRGREVIQITPEAAIYLHRKLLILDQHVLFGSHNLTKASTLTIDEYNIEVFSSHFADRMKALSKHSVQVNTVPFVAETVHQERVNTSMRQWFSSFFELFYLE